MFDIRSASRAFYEASRVIHEWIFCALSSRFTFIFTKDYNPNNMPKESTAVISDVGSSDNTRSNLSHASTDQSVLSAQPSSWLASMLGSSPLAYFRQERPQGSSPSVATSAQNTALGSWSLPQKSDSIDSDENKQRGEVIQQQMISGVAGGFA